LGALPVKHRQGFFYRSYPDYDKSGEFTPIIWLYCSVKLLLRGCASTLIYFVVDGTEKKRFDTVSRKA
jgi:hypothetical protein